MHPANHAKSTPDKPAIIMANSGKVITYAELDAQSNQVAQLLRARGIQIGDTIAICLENHPLYFPIVWGAQRAGLHYVCMSSRLTKDEAQYIVKDSGAKLLIMSNVLQDLAATLVDALASDADPPQMLMIDGNIASFEDFDELLCEKPPARIVDERAGVDMLYSSGTTGRPKGVKIPLPEDPLIDGPNVLTQLAQYLYQPNSDSIYLSPSPLYHAAPLRWCMTMHRLGATVIVMEHFDAEQTLQMIKRYEVTHAQFVPTHFVRMLKLPENIRTQYDVSRLKVAFHAAAPCPIPVKQAMIDWWGPIISEYYAGSEGTGMTHIRSDEWLAHPGSVGKAILGILHICDEDGNELPIGEEGIVYFDSPTSRFEYHNDPVKTTESKLSNGWMTLGDVGRVDDEGYLTLTDRKSFMIISGGVNIYPQEIENRIIIHPKVADVAVIGAPDEEMGERVVAVIQLAMMDDDSDVIRKELDAWCRETLSGVKIPRQYDFVKELPRHPTGKLYKRLLRDQYWENS